MIAQVKLKIAEENEPYRASMAYSLYAWLLSQVSADEGERLHRQALRPVSQYLWYDAQKQEHWWIVNLLNGEAVELFLPTLEQAETAQLHHKTLNFSAREVVQIDSAHDLIRQANDLKIDHRFTMELATPTAFKQKERYAIFPQESLILQSLVAKWELCFPDTPINDPDAMQAILQRVHIVDYRLQTLRYPLKQIQIPSFIGRVVLEMRLPAPLTEVFKTLYCFAPYAGLGVKTALGMGGVRLKAD